MCPISLPVLREMRRIVRPTGIVWLATNAEDAGGLLYDAHCAAAVELGYRPSVRPMPAFTWDTWRVVQEA